MTKLIITAALVLTTSIVSTFFKAPTVIKPTVAKTMLTTSADRNVLATAD